MQLDWILLLLCLLSFSTRETVAQNNTIHEEDSHDADEDADGDAVLIWSSTGGGWRAMFADIGYSNLFQQAGLFDHNSTRFASVATVSGGSWYSTQLFYSQAFYDQTVMAQSPDQLNQFVLRWMKSYYNVSSDIDNDIKAKCDTSKAQAEHPYSDAPKTWQDTCELLNQYNFDWAIFVQQMLNQAATDYGDPNFVETVASPDLRIPPMAQSDLLVLAALMPNSRIRDELLTSQAVYLGYQNATGVHQLFTAVLSASYVVQDSGSQFWYGSEDRTNQLQTYLARTNNKFAWDDWEPFFLYADKDKGTLTIDASQLDKIVTPNGAFREPYGGPEATTVLQIAAISSAAGGNGSPLIPSVYTQGLSMGYYAIEEAKVSTHWRILVGVAAGLGAGLLIGFFVCYAGIHWVEYTKTTSDNIGVCFGMCCGIVIGVVTALYYGLGSVLVPTAFDEVVGGIYQNSTFDHFAVCSQWPNPCGEQDGIFVDGWFIDNPALVINVGHQMQKGVLSPDKPLKVILTNTNQDWDTEWNRVQILQYFSTYFNENAAPGEFLWPPGYFAPLRSPQIFSEYLDQDGLDALVEPLPDSKMSTATIKGTTVHNPSFGVTAGQAVEILLLNLNEPITTFVVGKDVVTNLTQPLADMTSHIASNQELVQRVMDFVYS